MKFCRFSKQKNYLQVENIFFEATKILLVITYSYSEKPLLQNTQKNNQLLSGQRVSVANTN